MANEEIDTSRVGERLRKLREARGESMSVAKTIRERFGVKLDASYLSRMERGKVEIPLRTLFACAKYYEVDPCDLIRSDEYSDESPVHNMFLQPDLKSAFELLYVEMGKDNLVELLWWYFRILTRSVELGYDCKSEPHFSRVAPPELKRRRNG